MTLEQLASRDDVLVRRYEYDDSRVITADLGLSEGDATVDVLDDRVIVVIDNGDEPFQTEIELPKETDAQGFINNGIVTIKVGQ